MMNPGEKSTPFEPSMVFREILRPVTRQAISRWLATHPTSADGDPVIAIHQALFCEPVRDPDPLQAQNPLTSFEKKPIPGSHISARLFITIMGLEISGMVR